MCGGRGSSSATFTAMRFPFTTTALGHRQIVRKDADCVFFGGIQLDDGAATKPQHLMNRHGCGAQHHCDVEGDLIECSQVCSLYCESEGDGEQV
jgi:hypothetical protein